jgi:hypothetical protein
MDMYKTTEVKDMSASLDKGKKYTRKKISTYNEKPIARMHLKDVIKFID